MKAVPRREAVLPQVELSPVDNVSPGCYCKQNWSGNSEKKVLVEVCGHRPPSVFRSLPPSNCASILRRLTGDVRGNGGQQASNSRSKPETFWSKVSSLPAMCRGPLARNSAQILGWIAFRFDMWYLLLRWLGGLCPSRGCCTLGRCDEIATRCVSKMPVSLWVALKCGWSTSLVYLGE